MTLRLIPDVEQLVSGFLRAQPEVVAFFAAGVTSEGKSVTHPPTDRVYTDLPAGPVWPAVRVNRVGGSPVTNEPLWLDQALIQLDVFGGPKALARDLAETCRAVIDARLPGVHSEGVVTAVRFGQLAYHPDDTYPTARPKYDLLITIFTHPNT